MRDELAVQGLTLLAPPRGAAAKAASRERFLLVKSGRSGLFASRIFSDLATGWMAADELKTLYTC